MLRLQTTLFLCLVILFGLGTSFFSLPARAEVSVSPLRVVFGPRERSQDVTLLNLSDKRNTYRMDWVYNKMNVNGAYERQESSLTPEMDVAKSIVFSPRQVTLPPNSRQKVRLSLRRPENLPDGEYRAHLVFTKLADTGPASEAPGSRGQSGQDIKLNVNLGFSIPVIVRQGDYDANVTISDPKFIPVGQTKSGKPQLQLKINRTGKQSALGEVRIFWDRAEDPNKFIGRLDNVAVYPEMPYRIINIDLNEGNIPSGNLTVKYYSDGEDKNRVLAELKIPVGG